MAVLTLPLLFLLASYATLSNGETYNNPNITKILAQHPSLSTFNEYLTKTRLAGEINSRRTITILVVSNDGMAALLSRGLSSETLRHVLSLHVLVDVYGTKKLHALSDGTTLCSTLYQAYGAPDMSGYVNITMRRGGVVTFAPYDADPNTYTEAKFVKSIFEQKSDISVLQIDKVLDSQAADAPTESPSAVNLTDLMSSKGCKSFANLTLYTGNAYKILQNAIDGGLSCFCPADDAVDAFLPKFENLTDAGKLNLLLYHAVPVYYSMQMLRSNNGILYTLATDKKSFNFTDQNSGEFVTIKTLVGIVAKIIGTIRDEDPLALYTIDKVLEPRELFKKESLSPAPAPYEAPAPKASKGGKKKPSPGPAAGPGEVPADQKASDQNYAQRITRGGGLATMVMIMLVNLVL